MFLDLVPAIELVILGYFTVINSIYLSFTVMAFVDLLRYNRRVGRREFRTLLTDTTYRPISVLVPAFNEQETVVPTIHSLLMLGYPEFEIIVINDGSTDDTLDVLRQEFGLFPVPQATRITIPTAPVERVYRSVDHPNLVVLDKERRGKSDALNAGINASRYPLVCSIDADSLLESEALLRIAHAFSEDERIVAAGGIIRVLNGAEVEQGRVVAAKTPSRPLELSQCQEYVRGFLTGRAALAKLDSLLIIAGAFGLYRKSALVEAGGFANDTVCEDMEVVVRLHRLARENDRDSRVIFVPDPVCWTQVPTDLRSLLLQRDRWQRGLLESLWRHRKMFLNPNYGKVGMLGMPFYTFFEAIGPLFEIGGYIFLVVLFLMGQLSVTFAILFLILAVLYGVLLSLSAQILDDLLFRRYERPRDLLKMMFGAFLEYAGFRQLLTLTRALGFITVFQRKRGWGLMNRKTVSQVARAEERSERRRKSGKGLLGLFLVLACLFSPRPAIGQEGPDERIRTLLEEESFETAETALREALAEDPGDDELELLRAELLRRTDRMEEARQLYAELARNRPDDREPWFWLATVNRWLGHPDEAVAAYTHLLERNACDLGALRGRARVRRHEEELQAAETDLQRALECEPGDREAMAVMGEVLLTAGREEEAMEYLRESLSPAEAELRMATIAREKDELKTARKHLLAALETRPDDPEILSRLGAIDRLRQRHARSLEWYRQAARARPGDSGPYYWIGTLARWEGDVSGSLEAFRELERLEPESASALIGQARALRALGRRAEALERVERALELDPENTEALAVRGALLRDRGRPEEARGELRRALALSPRQEEALLGARWLGPRHGLEVGGRYSRSEVLEGLEDAGVVADGFVIRPVRIEYLGEELFSQVHSTVHRSSDLFLELNRSREGVFNLDADATVYDFDVTTGTTGFDHVVGTNWSLAWRAGAARYEPRDEASTIEDDTRFMGRAELVRDTGRSRFSLSGSRSPFIQRGFAGDFDFRIFDHDRISAAWDQRLSEHWELRTRAGASFFGDDGDDPYYAGIALDWKRGDEELSFGIRHDPFPARFLQDGFFLEFIDYEEAWLRGEASPVFGLTMRAEARYGIYEETVPQFVVDGVRVFGEPDENSHLYYTASVEWSPRKSGPFYLGASYIHDDYDFDTSPYNTTDLDSLELYTILSNRRGGLWRYYLRYGHFFIEDEKDPSYEADQIAVALERRLWASDEKPDRAIWITVNAFYDENDLEENRERYRLALRFPF